MQKGYVEIEGHRVGQGYPCFIIAEAGVNHNGNMKLARQLIDVAVDARCDSVKFQSFQTDLFVTANTPKAKYSLAGTNPHESHMQMIRVLELDEGKHKVLLSYCNERDITFLSSPFEEASADMLDRIGVSAFKIPSGELTNLPLLKRVAQKGKPMIVSTGMANLAEVEQAIETITKSGIEDIVLLHCTSSYPTEPQDVNLRAMQTLQAAFGFPVGYSDHTSGAEIALAAVAMGACLIEKHLTLDRALPGPDQQASLEPGEIKTLVSGIRAVEAALGDGRKNPRPCEMDTAIVARKSLVATSDIKAGTVLSESMLAVKRPGIGLPSSMIPIIVGRRVRKDVSENTLIALDMLD